MKSFLKHSKKLLSFMLLLALTALVATSCDGSLSMTELTVDESALQTSYYVGDTVDFSSASYSVKLNDGSTRTVDYANVKVLLGSDLLDITNNLSKITETAGTKKVTFSYEGLSYEISVKVSPKIDESQGAGTAEKVTLSLVIDTEDVDTAFEWGDAVTFTGLTASGEYSDDTEDIAIPFADLRFMIGTEDITQNLAKVTESAGEKEITVVWTNEGTSYTAKFSVTVTDPIVSYSLENAPASYAYGDTPSFAAILMYSHSKSGQKALVSGDKRFFIGETEITANIAVLTSAAGTRTVTVKVGEAEKTFDVVVTNPMASISLSKSEIVFEKNAAVDFSSVTVTATYADGTTSPVTEGVAYLLNNEAVNAALTATPGVKTVTVTYGGKTASLTVKVNKTKAELLDRITLSVTEKTADLGEIDLSAITVTAHYLANVDGTAAFTETVTADAVTVGSATVDNLANVDEATVGSNTVKFSFGGKTANLALTVADVLESLDITVNSSFNFGDTFTFTAEAVYRSTDRKPIDKDDVTVATADTLGVTAKVGSRTVTFTYEGKTATKTVTVNDVVESYTLSADAVHFVRGADNVSFNGVTVTANYRSKVTAAVTEGITYHLGATDITETPNKIAETFGTKIVTVKVNGVEIGSIEFEIAPNTDDKTMTVTNIEGLKAQYFYKDAVTLANVSFTVSFEVEGGATETKDLTLADVDYTVNGKEAAITDALGTSVIIISYTFNGVTYSAQLGRPEVIPELHAIEVKLPATASYGDTLSATVTAEYKNGVKDAVVTAYTMTANGSAITLAELATKLGSTTVTFSYKENGIERTAEATITVKDVLTGITASIDEANKNYVPGATLNTSVITVTATYKSEKTKTVTEFTVSGFDMNAADTDQTVTVTYTENGVEQKATVTIHIYKNKADALLDITLNVGSLNVALGKDLSNDISVTANYSDGYGSETVALSEVDFRLNGAEKALSDLTKNVTKDATVTAVYNGKEATFTLTVAPTALFVDNISTTWGVSVAAPTVTAVLTVGGTPETVDAGFNKVIADLITKVGTHEITASFMGVDAVFTLTVNDAVSGVTLPESTVLWVDVGTTDTSFLGNLTVTVTYFSGATRTAALSELVFSVTDWTSLCGELGNKSVQVWHKDKTDVTATFTLATRDVITEMKVVVDTTEWKPDEKLELMKDSSLTFGAFSFTVKYSRLNGEYAAPLADVRFFIGSTDITVTPAALVANTGDVTLTIQYTDDRGHVYTTTRTATVKAPQYTVWSFDEPDAVVKYNNAVEAANAAGDITHASTAVAGDDFESAFFKKDDYTYIVGDDNPYIFVPKMMVMGEDVSTSHEVYKFKTDTTVTATIGNTNVTLDKSAEAVVNGKNTVTYTYGGKTYLYAYVEENQYQFTADALNCIFTISVLPTYEWDGDAVSHTFKVVDGYNVTNAKQLSILEQSTDTDRAGLWDGIKTSQGIAPNQTAASVIFHDNIKMTRADMPKDSGSLMYTLPESEMNNLYDYASANDFGKADKRLSMKSSTFLYDNAMILQHEGAGGIHGNFFSLDFSELPYVASFANSATQDYGADFSNAAFLRVMSPTVKGSPASGNGNWNSNSFFIYNLDVNGNAGQSERVGPTNRPVNAGGVIFFKSHNSTVTWDNIKAKNCFITYLTDYVTKANINNLKAYDSYCASLFVWSGAEVNITNSNIERAGGPLLLLQQTKIESGHDARQHIPVVTIDSASQLINLVTGQESWFQSVGAGSEVAQILLLNELFKDEKVSKVITKSISQPDAKGKVYINLIGITMPSGGYETLTDVTVQGKLTYGNDAVIRDSSDTFHTLFQETLATGTTIVTTNNTNMIYFDGNMAPQNFVGDLTGLVTELATEAAYRQPSRITVYKGGLGMMLGLFDEAPQ